MGAPTTTFNAVIANGASLSGVVELGDSRLFAVQMPTAWTAGNLTFQVSDDGTDFYDLYDSDGSEVVVTAGGASRVIQLTNPARYLGLRWLKVRSGTTGTPVNQGAERTLVLICVV